MGLWAFGTKIGDLEWPWTAEWPAIILLRNSTEFISFGGQLGRSA